jgi:hypothetical protein
LQFDQFGDRRPSCSLAASTVGIPSILVTNFTFDSVYSYLSTTLVDAPVSHADDTHPHFNILIPDIPVPSTELEPLGMTRLHLFADLSLLIYHMCSSPNPCWIPLRTSSTSSAGIYSNSVVCYRPFPSFPRVGGSTHKSISQQRICVPG